MRAIDRLLRNRPKAGGLSLLGKIRALFANGEQGWWYDPSNLSTLFQDSAGTTPVTAMEQPVGLQLDLSKGLVLGPTLVTNGGPFTTTTGWVAQASTLSASSGNLVITATGAAAKARWTFTSVAGRAYQYSVTFAADATTGDSFIGVANDASFATSILSRNIGSTVGTYTGYFFATTTTTSIHVGASSASLAGETTSWSNISVRELPGNHRFQTTSANRPVVSARVNLLTKTEEFDNAVWTKGSLTVAANSGVAPDGTFTSDLVYPSSTGSLRQFYDATQSLTGTTRMSICVKSAGFQWVYLMYTAGVSSITTGSFFDIVNGAVGANGSGAGSAYNETITSLGNGWYRISIDIDNAANARRFCLGIADADNSFTATANGTSGIYIWGADLRVTNVGVNLPAYQRVNTSTDYDSTGFPIYIKPNGSNQFMQTNSINFSATDKMTVWQGVRKLSDAATSIIAELSTNYGASRQAFAVIGRSTGGYGFGSGGSNITSADVSTGYAAPITNVLTGIGDISGDVCTLRLSGAQVATSSADQGTGNYGNYPAYFYARGDASLYFNGNDYGSIARGAASTAAQITAGETYINSKTKAFV